jgi:hypothetical protein
VKLKRRQPQEKWTPAEVADDVEAACYGDADQPYVRAAAILRHAYERLPKAVLKSWEADAAAEYPGRGMPSHGVFKFDLSDDDRFALDMEHDKSVVIRDVDVAFDRDEADAIAVAWVGEPHTRCHLQNIPGTYQSALIEAVTGVPRFWNEFEISWWLQGDGPAVVTRNYPPLHNESDKPFHVMPIDVGRASYRAFLQSPTKESELRS